MMDNPEPLDPHKRPAKVFLRLPYQSALWRRAGSNKRGTVAIEFAIVAIPFFSLVLFIFQLGLHFFYQELLDNGLHNAVRQIQTGNAQNIANGKAYVAGYLYPAMGNLVDCSNLYVNVQILNFASGQDYHNFTTGTLPLANGTLDLGSFASNTFVNAGSSQFVLVTAIYVSPSFLGALIPNVFSTAFNGSQVDAIMSQVATYTENFPLTPPTAAAAPSCG